MRRRPPRSTRTYTLFSSTTFFRSYLQVATQFDLMGNPGHFVAGVRYETTTISSAALVPAPVTTDWVGENEFNVVSSGDSEFTRFKGHYQNWLPAFDLDVSPMDNVKLRASYSHTRPEEQPSAL